MPVAALVLAAGQSRRFGARKQLAELEGQPLVRRSLMALAPLFAPHLYCMLGAYADDIRPRVNDLATVIEHPDWREGMGSTLAAGVSEIHRRGYDGVLIALADQPHILEEHYQDLLDQFDGSRIVCARYADRNGVPAVFPAEFFPDLARLSGDKGARGLLNGGRVAVRSVLMPEAERDVDRPEDWVSRTG